MADQGYPFPLLHSQIHPVKHNIATVAAGKPLQFQHDPAALGGIRELEPDFLALRWQFDPFHLFQLFNTGLYQRGFVGLIAKPFDKIFGLLHLFILQPLGLP